MRRGGLMLLMWWVFCDGFFFDFDFVLCFLLFGLYFFFRGGGKVQNGVFIQ